MTGKPAVRAARLARAVLGGCVALSLPALAAAETLLQASHAGRPYVLRGGAGSYTLSAPGLGPTAVAHERGLVLEALGGLSGGWLAAGHRPGPDGAGRALVLLRGGDDGGVELLPAPPSSTETLISPQPLVEDGELRGLAWLEGEGPGALGVRAASWTGSGFAASSWVSPPGGGSQLALSATVLAGGDWLLVWSAFDGRDDEILWSRYDGGSWSAPARIHPDNAVPDITPVVTATARGAVAAWSRYDGGTYRARVMRFRDGDWWDEERVGGPGSVFPFFVRDDAADGPYLSFRVGVNGSWELLALDRTGAVSSRSSWRGEPWSRPLVTRGPGDRPVLERSSGGLLEREERR